MCKAQFGVAIKIRFVVDLSVRFATRLHIGDHICALLDGP